MKATIAWWDLTHSRQTVDSLGQYLETEGIRPWASIRGLRLKFWIADRTSNRWGAVMLWESDPGDQPLPPHRAAELIGYPPSERVRFDVEATIEGKYRQPNLSWQGRLFESPGSAEARASAAAQTKPLGTVPNEPELDDPPADPIQLFRVWFDRAVESGVREPGVVALATANAKGRASNRMVQTIRVTERGLVFASYSSSPKGRDIAQTGWASGVLYWRETGQQIILTGPIEQLSAAESDAIWAARPASALPMSVASEQSAALADERALRSKAERLAEGGRPLERPAVWVGYHLVPSAVEFWRASPDRLHRRLRYDRNESGWSWTRLQP